MALNMRNYTWAIWYNWRLVAPYSDLNGWKVKKVLRKKRNSLQSSKSNIISFTTKPFWGGEMILLSNCYKRCRVICILGKLFYLIHYELPVIHCFHFLPRIIILGLHVTTVVKTFLHSIVVWSVVNIVVHTPR